MYELKENLKKTIEIMNEGDLHNILGIKIILNHVEAFIFIY